MLKFKYLTENYDLAKEILSLWKFDDDNVDKELSLFRISSNAVYPFTVGGKRHFLRFAPTEEKKLDSILCELSFLQYLHDNGIDCNIPVASLDGNLLETVDTQFGQYYACVFVGVEGKRADNIPFGEKQIIKAGETLAKIHKLSTKFISPQKSISLDEVLDYIEIQLTEDSEPVKEKFAEVKAEVLAMPRSDDNFGLCHGDFETDNLFYEKRGDILSVIDFEDCHYNFYSYDVAVTLSNFAEDTNNFLSVDKIQKAFSKGYEKYFTLPESNEINLMYKLSLFFRYAKIVEVMYEDSISPFYAIQNQTNEAENEVAETENDVDSEVQPMPDYDDYESEEEIPDDLVEEEVEEETSPKAPLWLRLLKKKLALACLNIRAQLLK